MPERDSDKIIMEGVVLPGKMRNFSGEEGPYNRKGDRNFCVLLDEKVAKKMEKDGWNIGWLDPYEKGDPPQAFIRVTAKYDKGRPPRIFLITSRGRNLIDEEQVEFIDWIDIANADIIIRPYRWAVQDKTGIKAYLQSAYITVQEDPLELKYSNVPIIGELPVSERINVITPDNELSSGPAPLELEDPNIVDAEIVDE